MTKSDVSKFEKAVKDALAKELRPQIEKEVKAKVEKSLRRKVRADLKKELELKRQDFEEDLEDELAKAKQFLDESWTEAKEKELFAKIRETPSLEKTREVQAYFLDREIDCKTYLALFVASLEKSQTKYQWLTAGVLVVFTSFLTLAIALNIPLLLIAATTPSVLGVLGILFRWADLKLEFRKKYGAYSRLLADIQMAQVAITGEPVVVVDHWLERIVKAWANVVENHHPPISSQVEKVRYRIKTDMLDVDAIDDLLLAETEAEAADPGVKKSDHVST